MNLLIFLCVGIGLSIAAPLNEPELMIDPTPPPGYNSGRQGYPEPIPGDYRPRDDPSIMIDPTPPANYRPGSELQKDMPRELIPIVDPTRPGQYELPNQPGLMIDPTPPPGYVPLVGPTSPGQYKRPNQPGIMIDPTPPPGYIPQKWDVRTDPTIDPKEPLIMTDPPHLDEDISDEGEPYDPEFFSLTSGFADLDREKPKSE